MTGDEAMADDIDIEVHRDIAFAEIPGATLLGDLYKPKSPKAPIVVAVHGGGWQIGSRSFYANWGPFLAKRGYAVFAIDYRLAQAGRKAFPEAVSDVRAAVGFIRRQAEAFSLDAGRIALMGDSAGAQLTALVALSDRLPGEEADPKVDSAGPKMDGSAIKAAILFYGVYDMAAQWRHDQLVRPRDQITEKFLGVSPILNRRLYFDASPLSYAQQDHRNVSFLVTYGTEDNIVDRHTQSEAFVTALSEAGKYVRTVIVPFAPHFWSVDPIEEAGSYPGVVAPRLLRFLQDRL
jgi:acetyl esterase/lipase